VKDFNLNDLLKENDRLYKKLDRHRELIQLYRTALKTFARKYPELQNMNEAEKALEEGKKLEKLL
jgi:hypothetical protein